MSEPPSGSTTPPSTGGQEGRLDSWKKIAAYLKRDVSTVQRWERREGMPVHRHLHDKLGSVYAFRSELDAWWASRSARLAREDNAAEPVAAGHQEAQEGAQRDDAAAVPQETMPRVRPRPWPWVAAVAVLACASVGWQFLQRTEYSWKNPLANAQFRSLTDIEGTQNAATISRDGSKVAFLSDRDGPMDVWVTQVGSGRFQNLTGGSVPELVNPSIRTLGFSPDAALVSIWTRQPDGSRPEDISLQAAPIAGGPLRPYLAQTAEFEWSRDGRLVYHTTAPGDPVFVQQPNQTAARQIYVAPSGVHCHFPIWSPDNAFIYFVRGVPPNEWDIWRVSASGGGTPERITSLNTRVTHPVFLDGRTLLYLATDQDGSGPWLYSMDIERRIAHRLTSGIERYTSLAASEDGARLVVTVASSKSTLWRVPISEQALTESGVTRVALPSSHATSPRFGLGKLLYVSSEGGREGIWKQVAGTASEIWSDAHARITGAPSVAPDGRIAFVTETDGRTRLYVMHDDGSDSKIISDTLELRGSPAWAPDGQSIACAVNQNGTPRLFRFFPNGDSPALLVSEYSLDPVWSPDGQFLVYSGADVGTTFPLRAAAADGRVHPLHSLILTRGARRVSFLRGPSTLVILRGEIGNKNLWQVDLETGAQRQLTNLSRNFVIKDFDVSGDGQEIVFDRVQENSDLVLIDRIHH